MKDQIQAVCSRDAATLRSLLRTCFQETIWCPVWLDDSHHGFEHGFKVMEAVFKLRTQLTSSEQDEMQKEIMALPGLQPELHLEAALIIASLLHDCGRFNDRGVIVKEEQGTHHLLGADRARHFCQWLGLEDICSMVADAVESHDFQSQALTPDMHPPHSLVGRLVQATDQMGWFHPQSPKRSIAYNEAIGVPFYDSKLTLEERRAWLPNSHTADVVTVFLFQLFGPRGSDRFGIEAARIKVAHYREGLRQEIIGTCLERGLETEIQELLRIWEVPLAKTEKNALH